MNLKITAKTILSRSKKSINNTDLEIFLNYTSTMPSQWSIERKAYHVLHDIQDIPVCCRCSNDAKFLARSYWKWCSNKCMGSDPLTIEKKKQTNLKKWGTEHPQHLDFIKEKIQHTLLEKYGVTNFAKSNEFKQKFKSTSNKKYGVDNPSKCNEIIEKIRVKALNREYSNVLEKRQSTCLTKFGTTSSSNRHLPPETINKLNDLNFLMYQHMTLKKSCQEIANELGCSPTPILTRLTNAGIDVIRHNVSNVEKEIREYIETFTSDVIYNDRKIISPHELDIVLPNYNIAIEINGVYWHSELQGKDKHYHKRKTEMCYSKNLLLLHILDIEWINKTDIVKSKIAGIFKNHLRIPARKCKINTVTTQEKSVFLNQNHLQGSVGSSVNLGLYYNNELVSLATFGKPRYTKIAEWELIRFCNKINVSVQGGASKLFAHFIKTYNPISIISYADARWSSGHLYNQLGFEFLHTSEPNYSYFKSPNVLESRVKYQKHKLSKLFDNVDMNLTEWEIMQNQGYNRIWDCGNKVYIWKPQ